MAKRQALRELLDAAGEAVGRLKMDRASRMERAREAGFDTDMAWYHGTEKESADALKSGSDFYGDRVFVSPRRDIAEQYAENAIDPAVMKLYGIPARAEIDFDLPGSRTLTIEEARHYIEEPDWDLDDFVRAGYSVAFPSDAVRLAKASFDPAKKDSANLLASATGAGILGAAVAPEDAEAAVTTQSPGLLDTIATGANDAAGFVFDALEMPSRGLHGLGAVLGMLAEGATLEDALNRGATVAGQSIDRTAQDLGEYVARQTGNPYAAALTHALTQVTTLEP